MNITISAGIIGLSSIVGGVLLNPGQAHAQAAAPQASASTPANVVVVKAGDSLASIAQPRGMSYTRLYDANPNVADPNVIFPGNQLRIPAPDENLPNRLAAVVAASAPAAPVAQAAPAAAPAPAQVTTASATVAPAVADSSVWDRLAQCESSGNWAANTGNGFSGGLQFAPGTWAAHGGTGAAWQASREQQIAVAESVKASQGWGAWPACSAKLGLR